MAAHEPLVLTVKVQILAPQQCFHCVLFLVDWGIAGRSMHLPVKQKMKVQFLLPQQCLFGVMVTHWSPKPAMGVQILQGAHHRDVA